jgi:hypothetical protein
MPDNYREPHKNEERPQGPGSTPGPAHSVPMESRRKTQRTNDVRLYSLAAFFCILTGGLVPAVRAHANGWLASREWLALMVVWTGAMLAAAAAMTRVVLRRVPREDAQAYRVISRHLLSVLGLSGLSLAILTSVGRPVSAKWALIGPALCAWAGIAALTSLPRRHPGRLAALLAAIFALAAAAAMTVKVVQSGPAVRPARKWHDLPPKVIPAVMSVRGTLGLAPILVPPGMRVFQVKAASFVLSSMPGAVAVDARRKCRALANVGQIGG